MNVSRAAEYRRSGRQRVALVADILETAEQIKRCLSSDETLSKVDPGRRAIWKQRLDIFVDQLNDLRQACASPAVFPARHREELARSGGPFSALGCTEASATYLAHTVAELAFSAAGMTDATLDKLAAYSHDGLDDPMIRTILRAASNLANLGVIGREHVKRWQAHIDSEVARLRPVALSHARRRTDFKPVREESGIFYLMGRPVELRTKARQEVIRALIAAYPNGLTKNELVTHSGTEDAVKTLKRLHDSDSRWSAVIALPGKAYRGYRLQHPPRQEDFPT